MNYTVSRILAWIADNKMITFLGICLFSFVIATICLASEKNTLQEKLDQCQASKVEATTETPTTPPPATDTTPPPAPDTTTPTKETTTVTTTTTTETPDNRQKAVEPAPAEDAPAPSEAKAEPIPKMANYRSSERA